MVVAVAVAVAALVTQASRFEILLIVEPLSPQAMATTQAEAATAMMTVVRTVEKLLVT